MLGFPNVASFPLTKTDPSLPIIHIQPTHTSITKPYGNPFERASLTRFTIAKDRSLISISDVIVRVTEINDLRQPDCSVARIGLWVSALTETSTPCFSQVKKMQTTSIASKKFIQPLRGYSHWGFIGSDRLCCNKCKKYENRKNPAGNILPTETVNRFQILLCFPLCLCRIQ